jgi:hypothetical protein
MKGVYRAGVYFLLMIILSSTALACISKTELQLRERPQTEGLDPKQQEFIEYLCARIEPNIESYYYYNNPSCTSDNISCTKLFNESGFHKYLQNYKVCGLEATEEDSRIIASFLKANAYASIIVEQTDDEYDKFMWRARWVNFWKARGYKTYIDIEREGRWTKYTKRASTKGGVVQLC